MAKSKVKQVMTLSYSFDPGLSGKGAKILTVKPYDVTFEVIYEASKDADNPVLHNDLNRLWHAFCKIRAVKFQKEVEATVKLIFATSLSLKQSDSMQTDKASVIRALEQIVEKQNVKMSLAFDKWIQGYIREVTLTVNKWGSVNNDGRLVRATRTGKVVKDVAGIVHAVINPVSIKGKVKLASKFKTLYHDVKNSYGNADKRARRVLKALASLQKTLNTMDSHSKAGKLIKWSAKFNSIGDDVKNMIDAYDDEVKILKSKVKKMGAKLKALQDSDEPGASNAVRVATDKLIKAETDLSGHILQLGASKKQFEVMQVDRNLFSMTDKMRQKLKANLQKRMNKTDSLMRREIANMSNVGFFDGELATLENGLQVNARGAWIEI